MIGAGNSRSFRFVVLGASALSVGAQGCAEIPSIEAPLAGAPQTVAALRTSATIHLDGRLDESDWARASPLDRFYETYPGDRSAAPERTEVRLLYDSKYLYVGFRLFLKSEKGLRTPFVRRDKVGASHDYVQIYLDPQNSKRGSYIFRVNARGTKTDGFQNESQQSETLDPDYDWDVASNIDKLGWSSEMRIPLSTLRISREGAQQWAVLVTRGVPRQQNTQMATAPFPHDSSCFLCYASAVTFADLQPKAERLLITPSVTTTFHDNSGSSGTGSGLTIKPSFDAKFLPYSGAAIDLTIKPDFSQVEADQALLSANQRFALNLPEKRPFFREGADLVKTLIPAVYTRSIAAPDFGLRFTQRSSGLDGTAFLARDGGRPAIIEPGFLGSDLGFPDFKSYDGFARLRHTLSVGDVGGLAAAKVNTDGSRNFVVGGDASWATSKDRIVGQLLASDTHNPDRPDLLSSWTGQSLEGYAGLAQWNHTGTNVWSLSYQRIASGFRSWLGYVPRVGFQALHADFYHPFYSTAKLLNTIEPYVSFDGLNGIGSQHGHERDPLVGLVLAGYRNLAINLSYHPQTIVLDGLGRERSTHFLAWTASLNPAPRIPVISISGNTGSVVDYTTGDVVPGTTLGFRIVARPLDRVELEIRRDQTSLQSLDGSGLQLSEKINQILATYYFNARFYTLLNFQKYESNRRIPNSKRTGKTSLSMQFNWDVARDFQMFWGLRSGSKDLYQPGSQGRSTEVYLKLSRTFRP